MVLINAIPDTNHNANPTNPNRNSKGSHNLTNPSTRYRCEYDTLNSMFAWFDYTEMTVSYFFLSTSIIYYV